MLVGTAKRERQKANRQLRLEQLAKEARVQKTKRTGMRIALLVGAVVVVVGLIAVFGGDDSSNTTATATTEACTPTSTTLAPPEKPTVTVPTEAVTELKVTPLVAGECAAAKVGDTVEVYYVGVLSADGTEFDANYGSGSTFPVTIGTTSVIQGWTQGLIGVQAGGRYQIDIPSDLAYGDAGQGSIPGGAALTFVVDIVSVTPGAASTGA